VRRRRVGPRIGEGSKPGLLAGDRRKGVEKVAGRAGQPVEPGHHHHVAGADLVQQTDAAAAGRCWLRSPPRETLSWLRRHEVGAPAPPRFARPSIPARTRRSWAGLCNKLPQGKSQIRFLQQGGRTSDGARSPRANHTGVTRGAVSKAKSISASAARAGESALWPPSLRGCKSRAASYLRV
jgi:hypothetical protein